MAKALEQGLLWTILDPEVEDLYPSLPNLVQRARQAVGQVQHEESVLQLAAAVQELASQQESTGQNADFTAIAANVLQSQPRHPEMIPQICEFVQKYGGGRNGQYVKEINTFVALCCQSDRTLTGRFLEAFTKLRLTTAELCPDFVAASIKMHLNAPDDKVIAGVSRFLKEVKTA